MSNGWMDQAKWLLSRIGVIYLLLAVIICLGVDIKTVDKRTKIRNLNGARPDFTMMNDFLEKKIPPQQMNWVPYQKYFELVMTYMPNDPTAAGLLGYVYYHAGQENKAIALLRMTADSGPDMFWSNYNLGVVCYKKGQFEIAINYLTRAIRSNPMVIRDYAYSSVIYRQILAGYRNNYNFKDSLMEAYSDAYLLIEASMGHLKQYDQMLSVAGSAMAMRELPYQDGHLFYAAVACLQLKQLEKALLLFERSMAVEKNNPTVYLYLSQIYKAVGKDDAAAELMKVYQTLDKKNDPRFPYDERISLRYL